MEKSEAGIPQGAKGSPTHANGVPQRKSELRPVSMMLNVIANPWILLVSMLGLTCVFLAMHNLGAQLINLAHPWYESAVASEDPVEAVLRGAPLIDTHNDLPIWIRAFYRNDIYQKNFTNTSKLFGQVDFPRLQQGGVRGQFWSVYVGCPEDVFPASTDGNYSTAVYLPGVHQTLQQIDLVHRLYSLFPDNLSPALTSTDVWHQFHQHPRSKPSPAPISSLLGAEGLHQIANSASVLRLYHTLGVRYVTLTHSCHNAYADSCSPSEPLHGGLSAAGVAMVREMNRLGMAVDLSHVSAATMRHTLNVTRAPVLFSHSSAHAVCPHPRNVPDDVLRLVAKNGGVVQVTFVPDFVNCDDPSEASLADVADHVQHIGALVGYDHVGLGGDFDGMPKGPRGLEDVSKYPDLIRELLRRGVSVADMRKVVGGNVLRVLRGVEETAARMRDVRPLQDEVRGFAQDAFLREAFKEAVG